MNPKRVLQNRRNHIFKTWVTPALHAAGFRKRGIVYVRDLGSVQHLFNHETDKINMAGKSSFTTNCGIYVPGSKLSTGVRAASNPRHLMQRTDS